MVSAIQASAAELTARAQSMSDVNEMDDEAIDERLERMLNSLNTEAHLSAAGAQGMERHIVRVLANRLRMQRDFRLHPEIGRQTILPPVVISGGPRAGSTKLHKILAASGDFLHLQCWQGINFALFTADRAEDTAPRICDAAERVRWFNEHSPQSRLIHEFSTFEPEEENLIYEHRLYGPYLSPFLNVPSYVKWYMDNVDYRGELEFLKRALQYLQWQFHDGDPRPWLLKNPGYLGYEHLIAEMFPGVTLVTTHRDPLDVVSSGASLNMYFQKAYSDDDRQAVVANEVMNGIAASWQLHLKVRAENPMLDILDTGYTEITRSIEGAVSRIYAKARMCLSVNSRQAMSEWERDNAIHKHGTHKHSLAAFGVKPETVRECFRPYIDRFEARF